MTKQSAHAYPTAETRDFHLGDILSITTGILMSPRKIEGVYDILGYMSGEDLFTHALPRVGDEAKPVLLRAHPELADIVLPKITTDNYKSVMAGLVKKYGEMLPVPKMTRDQHTSFSPFAEPALRGKKAIAVAVGK